MVWASYAGRVTIRGVLLDFSGTLFRLEITGEWLPDAASAEQVQLLMRALTAPIEPATDLPPELAAEWHDRDLDQDAHRRVYLAAIRNAGLREPGLAEQAYERLHEPANWIPYPDTEAALERLRAAAIPVAVVSNIAWDISATFEHHGIAGLVDEFVLSYVEGVVKPDAKIFRTACERIGVEPAAALMIGDSAEADGGAAALGSAVEIVPPLPITERPDALLAALAAHGL